MPAGAGLQECKEGGGVGGSGVGGGVVGTECEEGGCGRGVGGKERYGRVLEGVQVLDAIQAFGCVSQ